jgi:hypothetical protein
MEKLRMMTAVARHRQMERLGCQTTHFKCKCLRRKKKIYDCSLI